MKKFLWYTLAALLTVAAFSSCEKNPEPEPEPSNVVATVTASNLLDAVAAAYDAWEDNTTIPTTLQVGSTSLTLPQYQYAMAKLLVNLASNDKGDVKVLGYKEADHPERDSYDQKEIAVTGGAKITEGTEDLVDIAKRMMKAMEEKLTVPNQTVITRTGASALAFSTNRATVTLMRALAAYKKSGSLPAKVETEYLSAAASLKGFAQQFVQILDIWEKTVGTVSADGSHCTDNNSAWQNVHFVPIPHSGGAYADGKDQYAEEYKPYFTVTIDGTTYTSAQTWGIALRGIMDMITKEGSAKMQVNRNPFEHTMGNGASLKEPIPAITENDIWGQYPWYESTNDGPAINQDQFSPYLIARCASWFLTRQEALGKIGNYQFFTTDPENGFVEDGVSGFVSSMRMWLIAARFYKYLLDNNITENVYDAVKNVTFSTDLYGVEMPDIELKTKKVDLEYLGNPIEAKFSSKKAWTAEPSDAWIHVEPASGDPADEVVVAISADANEGEERSGSVLIKGGNVTEGLAITVNQAKYVAPAKATLKEFAQEFVKGLDVWEATVGTVESEGYHLISKGTAWENVHYIPVGHTGGGYDDHGGNQYDESIHPAWTLNIGGETYTSAQAYEIAVKGLLNMVIAEGEAFLPTMDDRNKAYTLADNKSFSELPMATPTDKAKWGGYPWYEQDDYYTSMTYNGQPVESVDINFVVKAVAWHLVRGTVATSNNSPLGNIGNFQVFDTDPGTLTLDGYLGYISPMRELLIMMRIYKYLLDNNIDSNVYTAIKDQKFSFDLYNQGVAPKVFTIKDFAQEYVKILDIWQNTTGTIDMVTGEDYTQGTNNVENAHYVPSTTTISVGGKTYNTADMFETALRSYLLIRGYNGLDTENYGAGSIAALDGGAASMSATEVPETHGYEWGGWPFNETEGNGGHFRTTDEQHSVAKVDVLDNWAMRALNYSGGKPISNMCTYPRNPITNYTGSFCSQRALLTYAFFFKYMLDNNLDKGTEVSDTQIIRSELFGDEGGAAAKVTIKDFAKEYVKILDIWQSTTGTIDMVTGEDYTQGTNNVENAHYVPSTTTIVVGGKTYNTADMFETALRSYLLIRGYNGLDTENYGAGSIAALDGGAASMSATEVPETHGYTWGDWPFNETEGNGGHFRTTDEQHSVAKVDVLDNWAMRALNYSGGKPISNMCTYPRNPITNYTGSFCSQRALLTYAFFFKYMLDNNLDKGTEVSDTQIIRSELFGDEGPKAATLKDFAQEFVKGLEVWKNTVGTVESEGKHLIEKGTAYENVHFIPVGKTLGAYDDHEGNQHDAKWEVWKLNVGGQEISSSQAWEIAIRGLMNLVTAEGEAFLPTMDDRNKAYTLANNAKFSTAPIPSATEGNIWGNYPWYEADDNYSGLLYNGAPVSEVDVNFMVKVGAWHVVRSFVKTAGNSPLGKIGNYQQFGTSKSTLNLEGYDGLIAPMRELLVLMRIYKYMLDNNVDANVYDALKDQKFDFDLYGVK